MAIVFDKPAMVDPYGIGALGTALGQGLGKGMVQQQEATTLGQILNPILNNPNPQTADLLKAVLGIAQAPVSPEAKQTALYGLHSAALRPQAETGRTTIYDSESGKAVGRYPDSKVNDLLEKNPGWTVNPPKITRVSVFNMKTGKKVGSMSVNEDLMDEKEAELNEKNLTLNAPEKDAEKPLNQYDDFIRTTEKEVKEKYPKLTDDQAHRLALKQWEKREARLAQEKKGGEKLTMSDVRTGYNMEMNSIKTRMLIDMTPEDRNMFSNLPPEQMLAAILGGAGKSLSQEKKKQYTDEIKSVDDYYGQQTQAILGRKGVKSKTPKEKSGTSGRDISTASAYIKEAKTKEDAITRIKALADQGWTQEELVRAAKGAGWE